MLTDLASRIGRDRGATPMIVEGRTGTTLAAVGEPRDHQVASAAISAALNKQLGLKLERAAVYKQELEDRAVQRRQPEPAAHGRRSGPPKLRMADVDAKSVSTLSAATAPLTVRRNIVGMPDGRLSRAAPDDSALTRCGIADDMTFGAVCEYRDELGRPRYVASTQQQPELSWQGDYQRHPELRSLAHSGGSASVVWAGVGRGPCCGGAEMQAAREAVARDRSERQRVRELSSAKPYSRHGHLLT